MRILKILQKIQPSAARDAWDSMVASGVVRTARGAGYYTLSASRLLRNVRVEGPVESTFI